MIANLPDCKPYEYLRDKPYHHELCEDDWIYMEWETLRELPYEALRDIAPKRVVGALSLDLKNIFAKAKVSDQRPSCSPSPTPSRSLSITSEAPSSSELSEFCSDVEGQTITREDSGPMRTLGTKVHMDPALISEEEFRESEWSNEAYLPSPEGVNPSVSGSAVANSPQEKYQAVIREAFAGVCDPHSRRGFHSIMGKPVYSKIMYRIWVAGGGRLGEVRKRMEQQFKSNKRRLRAQLKKGMKEAKKKSKKSTSVSEGPSFSSLSPTSSDLSPTSSVGQTRAAGKFSGSNLSKNFFQSSTDMESRSGPVTRRRFQLGTTSPPPPATSKSRDSPSSSSSPKRSRKSPRSSPVKEPVTPESESSPMTMTKHLRVKQNFVAAQRQMAEKYREGSWWDVKCSGCQMGKARVEAVCDVRWSESYPTDGDFREPYHLWVTEITLSRHYENAAWDITKDGAAEGLFCSQDGSTSYSSLAEAYHAVSWKGGCFIHDQLLKPQ